MIIRCGSAIRARCNSCRAGLQRCGRRGDGADHTLTGGGRGGEVSQVRYPGRTTGGRRRQGRAQQSALVNSDTSVESSLWTRRLSRLSRGGEGGGKLQRSGAAVCILERGRKQQAASQGAPEHPLGGCPIRRAARPTLPPGSAYGRRRSRCYQAGQASLHWRRAGCGTGLMGEGEGRRAEAD